MNNPKNRFVNFLEVNTEIQSRPEIPKDYYCKCEYCNPDRFKGELFHNDSNRYYSNNIRRHYYLNKGGEHLDVGQMVGYRWAIQNFCPKNGWVFDPTVGSGTAIVEAINNERNGVGIELEYPEVAEKSIINQTSKQKAFLIPGDALDTIKLLKSYGFGKNSIDLIVNGPPYPTNGNFSSDAPERGLGKEGQKKTFDYEHQKNVGLLKGVEWEETIKSIFNQSIYFLKPGGYLIILVKDMIRDRKIFNLHKQTIDLIEEGNPEMGYDGFYIHRHTPHTLFMRTYPKRFPDIKIPHYQTGIILKKNG